jgi:hypothetical protein
MAVSAAINKVFGHFQNLNLLILLQDLRQGRTARQSWLSGDLLCPVAHGLPAGQRVRELCALGQTADLEQGCIYAARQLGADPAAVFHFVRSWDEHALGSEWLTHQLEEMWQERLADGVAMQEVLEPARFEIVDRRFRVSRV